MKKKINVFFFIIFSIFIQEQQPILINQIKKKTLSIQVVSTQKIKDKILHGDRCPIVRFGIHQDRWIKRQEMHLYRVSLNLK